MYKYGTDYRQQEPCSLSHVAVCRYTLHRVVTTTYKTYFVTYRGLSRSEKKVQKHTSHILVLRFEMLPNVPSQLDIPDQRYKAVDTVQVQSVFILQRSSEVRSPSQLTGELHSCSRVLFQISAWETTGNRRQDKSLQRSEPSTFGIQVYNDTVGVVTTQQLSANKIVRCVYKPTRCTKFLQLDFIFYQVLYMFRTVLVHLQEQLL